MLEKKVLVEISVPSVGRKFDVYIPLDCKMYLVNEMVASSIGELSEGRFLPSKDSVLCDAETGIIFNSNKYVDELEIKNGKSLILI